MSSKSHNRNNNNNNNQLQQQVHHYQHQGHGVGAINLPPQPPPNHPSLNTTTSVGHGIAIGGTVENPLFLDDLVQDFDISLSGFGCDNTNVSLMRDLNQVISTLGDTIKVETVDHIDDDDAQDSTDAQQKFITYSQSDSPQSNDSCGSVTSTDSGDSSRLPTVGKSYIQLSPQSPPQPPPLQPSLPHTPQHQQQQQSPHPLMVPSMSAPSTYQPTGISSTGSLGGTTATTTAAAAAAVTDVDNKVLLTARELARRASKRLCFKGIATASSAAAAATDDVLSPLGMAPDSHNKFPSDGSDSTTNELSTGSIDTTTTTTTTSNSSSLLSARNMENSYGYSWRRYSKTDAPSVHNRMSSVQIGRTIKSEPSTDSPRWFQYILGAATASGVKHGAMTMTYMNQSQPYEIRLKKTVPEIVGRINYDGKNLRTRVRLGFVEKRLQYRESDEMANWCRLHSKDRLIDVDGALSYGVFDIQIRPQQINGLEFVWNPNREASIFVKLNCISTEFTSKRHGGERGTPLRLIIDTYCASNNVKLDSAQCLVKVFKSKGADRKHKTDRERLARLPDSSLYYQPSYDCTLFTVFCEGDEVMIPTTSSPNDSDCSGSHISSSSSSSALVVTAANLTTATTATQSSPDSLSTTQTSSSVQLNVATSSTNICHPLSPHTSDDGMIGPTGSSSSTRSSPMSVQPLSESAASSTETYDWLVRYRFNRLTETLANFSPEDLRRLSRDDLIQICGLTDGIRLFNTLHAIQGTTRLTIFVTTDGKVYHGIYLKSLTNDELKDRLIEMIGQTTTTTTTSMTTSMTTSTGTVTTCIPVRHIYLMGPNDIKIRLTNQVVMNMKNESIYCLTVDKDQEEYDLILQLTSY
ncbi:upstream-binding protein 1-like [Oppia nitens]|uniref:upstream-binding protein 1-like n=1 Tax=Oppia nitens TaxID=1686743 RepID=UPI0023DA05BE|nr:upstream-binding protein 1-like [Oppia nitens]